MSLTNENNSQNSTVPENIMAGRETPPCVQDLVEHFCRQSRHVQLYEVLRQLVTQSTSQLKHVSAWETKHGTRTTNVVGEISVSFKLPEDCAIDIGEVDKIIRSPVPQDTQNVPQFSFFERLNGWNIVCKKRSNGKSCDMFYRHEKSHRTFRSTVEVVNFLLYEAYTDHKQPKANKSKSGGHYLEQRFEHKKGLRKRKMISQISSSSSSKSKENMCFSSACVDPKEAHEMVEEFLDTSYNNLLNHFNEEENVPQGNKKGRVEEHKEEGQSTVNPIQEQANLMEVQTNLVEVEDNIDAYSSSPSAYTEQCDLINHIPQVSKYELVFFLGKNRQINGDVF